MLCVYLSLDYYLDVLSQLWPLMPNFIHTMVFFYVPKPFVTQRKVDV